MLRTLKVWGYVAAIALVLLGGLGTWHAAELGESPTWCSLALGLLAALNVTTWVLYMHERMRPRSLLLRGPGEPGPLLSPVRDQYGPGCYLGLENVARDAHGFNAKFARRAVRPLVPVPWDFGDVDVLSADGKRMAVIAWDAIPPGCLVHITKGAAAGRSEDHPRATIRYSVLREAGDLLFGADPERILGVKARDGAGGSTWAQDVQKAREEWAMEAFDVPASAHPAAPAVGHLHQADYQFALLRLLSGGDTLTPMELARQLSHWKCCTVYLLRVEERLAVLAAGGLVDPVTPPSPTDLLTRRWKITPQGEQRASIANGQTTCVTCGAPIPNTRELHVHLGRKVDGPGIERLAVCPQAGRVQP